MDPYGLRGRWGQNQLICFAYFAGNIWTNGLGQKWQCIFRWIQIILIKVKERRRFWPPRGSTSFQKHRFRWQQTAHMGWILCKFMYFPSIIFGAKIQIRISRTRWRKLRQIKTHRRWMTMNSPKFSMKLTTMETDTLRPERPKRHSEN